MKYSPDSLEEVALQILLGFGCDANEAAIVADHLIRANLAGHDSHGIGMLPMYGQQIEDGNLIPNQTPEFFPAAGAIRVVDARRGFGHRMALLALDHAFEAAREHNVAVLGLRNSGHVSRTGNYSEYCASKGFISLHFVNVWGHAPTVAPFGSCDPGFSTNPISIGIPVNGEARPMLDLATSTVALGKVRVAHNKGEKVPHGWIIDDAGSPTTDPGPMWLERKGALTAFGEHKGSGLGLFVELLAGAVAGKETVATGNYIPRGVFNNMFSILINPQGFDDQAAIEARVLEFYQAIKGGNPLPATDEILMPGEPEERKAADRTANGVDVDNETISQLMQTASDFKLDPVSLGNVLVECT
ncbi:hypothetical protein AB833_10810 [Chromatiales bacterium (ex Bugula neritina AB1)]|nr:hypothetical protein AB833_10810 [Chromatiales bacterium (ex Bugula neritina AB1)]